VVCTGCPITHGIHCKNPSKRSVSLENGLEEKKGKNQCQKTSFLAPLIQSWVYQAWRMKRALHWWVGHFCRWSVVWARACHKLGKNITKKSMHQNLTPWIWKVWSSSSFYFILERYSNICQWLFLENIALKTLRTSGNSAVEAWSREGHIWSRGFKSRQGVRTFFDFFFLFSLFKKTLMKIQKLITRLRLVTIYCIFTRVFQDLTLIW
jgi:hypothetical protein